MAVPMDCYVEDTIVCRVKNGQETLCIVNNGIINFKCGLPYNPMSDVVCLDTNNKDEIRIVVRLSGWRPRIQVEVIDKSAVVAPKIESIGNLIDNPKENLIIEKNKFVPTTKIGSYFALNDETKQWAVRKGILSTFKYADVYDYKDILDFELLEDGTSIIKGGLARSVVGGAIFGGVGAVVGGVTGNRKVHQKCNSLKIKITLNRTDMPIIYINLISKPIEKYYEAYKDAYNNAQKILSLLQIICNQVMEDNSSVEKTNYFSVADEIRKFKQLFDDGIISEEEFNTKKKQLLEQ